MTALEQVSLYGLDFSTSTAHDKFCSSISDWIVPDLSFERCRFRNAVEVANALSAMQHVQHIRLTRLMFGDSSLPSFLARLAEGMPGMLKVESFVCDPWREEQLLADEEKEDAVETIIRAAATMPRLKQLEVHVQSFPPSTDDALAACARENSQLEELTVHWPPLSPLERYATPALCNAMSTNCTMKRINFKHTILPFDTRSFWDASDAKKIATLIRLNERGRAYLTTEPNCRSAGVSVLEQVSDDIDCLFVHLRENPLLCKIKAASDCENELGQRWGQDVKCFLGAGGFVSVACMLK